MIKLNSAIPLYQQVAEDLKNRIEQGEFCSGQSIPSEAKIRKSPVVAAQHASSVLCSPIFLESRAFRPTAVPTPTAIIKN